MHVPLSHHLPRFSRTQGLPSPRPSPLPSPAGRLPAHAAAPDAVLPGAADAVIEARLAAARAEAKAEARAEAEAEFALRLRRGEEEHAEAIARRDAERDAAREAERQADAAAAAETIAAAVEAARSDWAASGAADLGGRLDEGLAALRRQLSADLADALRPLLAEAAAARALAFFAAALDQLLADPARPAVTVRGPAALIAALQALRGDLAGLAGVGFVESGEGEPAELRLTADGAHVETRLAAAAAALGVGDPPTDALERPR